VQVKVVEIIRSLPVRVSWFTPYTIVASKSVPGAETITLPAPASICA